MDMNSYTIFESAKEAAQYFKVDLSTIYYKQEDKI